MSGAQAHAHLPGRTVDRQWHGGGTGAFPGSPGGHAGKPQSCRAALSSAKHRQCIPSQGLLGNGVPGLSNLVLEKCQARAAHLLALSFVSYEQKQVLSKQMDKLPKQVLKL